MRIHVRKQWAVVLLLLLQGVDTLLLRAVKRDNHLIDAWQSSVFISVFECPLLNILLRFRLPWSFDALSELYSCTALPPNQKNSSNVIKETRPKCIIEVQNHNMSGCGSLSSMNGGNKYQLGQILFGERENWQASTSRI